MIDGDRWQRVDALFQRLAPLPAEERAEALRGLGAEDLELRREVEELLAADAREDPLLDDPDGWSRRASRGLDGVIAGERVGPYRVLEEIGAGGSSTVYLAQRADERYEKKVAVKVLKSELVAGQTLDRFRRECQILASLEHPSIARILDAGDSAVGVPYVVMEHVDGTRIDRYCDDAKLSLEDRLRLFCRVCRAVHYAHGHLVVHRDIKPSNILVDAGGEPKLLDFGIALLLHGSESEGDERTQTRLQPMTPRYASPEQLRGERVTTATDVYSLGLLLFRLLAGRLPGSRRAGDGSWDPAPLHRGPAAAEAPKPSSLVGSAEGSKALEGLLGGTSRRAWQKALEGDLDAIAQKALRPEPSHRYASAEQLAEDVDRFLSHQPVQARQGTWAYHLGRLLRRYRLAAALAAGLSLSLAAWAGTSSMQARQVERQAGRAAAISDFLVELLESADPTQTGGETPSLRTALDHGAERLRALDADLEVKSAVASTLSRAYLNQGLTKEARPILLEALRLSRQAHGSGDAEFADSLFQLSRYWKAEGHFVRGKALLRSALQIFEEAEATDRETYLKGLTHLTWYLELEGEVQASRELAEEIVRRTRDLRGDENAEVASALAVLGSVLEKQGRWDEAETAYREASVMGRRHLGAEHPEVLTMEKNLALVLIQTGDLEEADELSRGVFDAERRIFGEENPRVAFTLSRLVLIAQKQGDVERALELHEQVIGLRRKLFGDQHPASLISRSNLAHYYYQLGRIAEAEEVYRSILEPARQAFPPSSPYLSWFLLGSGRTHRARGRLREAEALLREARKVYGRATSRDRSYEAQIDLALGLCLAALGRDEEAHGLLSAGVEGFQEQGRGDAVDLPEALAWLEGRPGPAHRAEPDRGEG